MGILSNPTISDLVWLICVKLNFYFLVNYLGTKLYIPSDASGTTSITICIPGV